MARVLVALAGVFLAVAVYCGLDPFKRGAMVGFPGFEVYPVDQPRGGAAIPGPGAGPRERGLRSEGEGPYAGVADGRVLFWDGNSWTDFAYTSPNRSELCDPKPSPMLYLKNEHICGRPLGLRFDKKSGDMYIADAYFGLLKVGPEGGLATTSPLKLKEFHAARLHCRALRPIVEVQPVTKETSVLVRNLQFSNGVSISKDRTFLVFCEGSRGSWSQIIGQVDQVLAEGEKAGTTETFAILPGFPDNVRTNEAGEFWVAIHCRRNLYSHLSSLFPRLRKLLLNLPITPRQHFLLHIGGRLQGVIAKYGPDGQLLKILEDREGKVVRACSEVEEKDGKLWIGSVLMPYIAVYDLN
ncbi:unnamed protein product [Spirodela intermedia]|uniref:Strictosidine synthase conserved region domain-containing protein n=1 Tax=Spirodela intermedia TaxID=51605 RepID=A0A7I8I9N6_SPIIN|nr:unnamed protein product [Spirodela intermedia]CAA6653772.1 unnamed protein product [Spirodela intermedia]